MRAFGVLCDGEEGQNGTYHVRNRESFCDRVL